MPGFPWSIRLGNIKAGLVKIILVICIEGSEQRVGSIVVATIR
jgi:hypothetical protein